MTPLCTRIYTHPFFEATPPGAAPGPPVKNRVPVFATSGGVNTGLLMPHLKSKRSLVLNNGNIPHSTYVSSWCGSSIRTRTRWDFPRFGSREKCNERPPIMLGILLWFFWVHVDTFRLISGLLTMILVWDVGSAHLKTGPNYQRGFRNTPVLNKTLTEISPFLLSLSIL